MKDLVKVVFGLLVIGYIIFCLVSANDKSDDSTSEPLSGEDLSEYAHQEAESGYIGKFTLRFSTYAAQNGIELNRFSDREKVDNYLAEVTASQALTNQNTYILQTDSELFGGNYFTATPISEFNTDYYSGEAVYIGEVNSNNRPDGCGMISFPLNDIYADSESPTTIITYMGEFKNGRKNGYGVQFYIPDSFYIPQTVYNLAENKAVNSGIDVYEPLSEEYYFAYEYEFGGGYSDEYTKAVHDNYDSIMHNLVNIPIYEGNFKDNKFSGKGNYSCHFVGFVDEFDYTKSQDSEGFRIADSEIISKCFEKNDYLMMYAGLYVGTFSNGKPTNAKLYEDGELVYDGKWNDFEDRQ